MIICIGHKDFVSLSNSHTTSFSKLTFHNTELSKLAVVNHLLPLDLSLGRKDDRLRRCGGHQGNT